MLEELNHIFTRTYLRNEHFDAFLSSLVENEKLTGGNHIQFWKKVNFLDIQQAGFSQMEMLSAFERVLLDKCGLAINDCRSYSNVYVYLDDGICSGGRVTSDLTDWIENEAPERAIVHILVMYLYSYGKYKALKQLKQTAKNVGKHITFKFWRVREFENRRTYSNASEVLRPRGIPDDEATRAYAESLKIAKHPYDLTLRTSHQNGSNSVFSSEAGRHILEQQFLKAGVRIRELCPYLNEYQRPLGNMTFNELGFGSVVVTYRNCPNNAPLAFWVDEPWYPLFPRKTN